MKIKLIAYPNCSTCKNAEKYLKEHGIDYAYFHIVEQTPTKQELKQWVQLYQFPIRKLFNTSGKVYQSLQLKDRVPTMSEDEMLTLLAMNGMLIKRPLLISEKQMIVGYKKEAYDAFFSTLDSL